MSNFAKDVQLLADLQGLIDEAKKAAYPPAYAADVIGNISPLLKKVMPVAQQQARNKIDVLTRAKTRLSELLEEVHQ